MNIKGLWFTRIHLEPISHHRLFIGVWNINYALIVEIGFQNKSQKIPCCHSIPSILLPSWISETDRWDDNSFFLMSSRRVWYMFHLHLFMKLSIEAAVLWMEWIFLFTLSSREELAALSNFMSLREREKGVVIHTSPFKTTQETWVLKRHADMLLRNVLDKASMAVMLGILFPLSLLLVLSLVSLHIILPVLLPLLGLLHHLPPLPLQVLCREFPTHKTDKTR